MQNENQIDNRLRLKLLDGTQSLVSGIGYLYGYDTVKDCMDDPLLEEYITEFLHKEVVPSLDVERNLANKFVDNIVLHIKKFYHDYPLIKATEMYSTKMKEGNVRNVLSFFKKYQEVPKYFSFGFAAYILFMKCVKEENGFHFGKRGDGFYPLKDPITAYLCVIWKNADTNTPHETRKFVDKIIKDNHLWDDLSGVDGFSELVAHYLYEMIQKGMRNALEDFIEMGD